MTTSAAKIKVFDDHVYIQKIDSMLELEDSLYINLVTYNPERFTNVEIDNCRGLSVYFLMCIVDYFPKLETIKITSSSDYVLSRYVKRDLEANIFNILNSCKSIELSINNFDFDNSLHNTNTNLEKLKVFKHCWIKNKTREVTEYKIQHDEVSIDSLKLKMFPRLSSLSASNLNLCSDSDRLYYLNTLELYHISQESIEGCKILPYLKHLTLSNFTNPSISLSILAKFPALETLVLSGKFKDYNEIASNLRYLKKLKIDSVEEIRLENLKDLSMLKKLTVNHCSNLYLEGISSFRRLNTIHVKGSNIKDFPLVKREEFINKKEFVKCYSLENLTKVSIIESYSRNDSEML